MDILAPEADLSCGFPVMVYFLKLHVPLAAQELQHRFLAHRVGLSGQPRHDPGPFDFVGFDAALGIGEHPHHLHPGSA